MAFDIRGNVRKKISAPFYALNVDAPQCLTPEVTNQDEQTTTNDDIEDIDAISSSMESQISKVITNNILKPTGRPITQILDSFNKQVKNTTYRDSASEFSDIFSGNQTEATTNIFDDTTRTKIKFDHVPAAPMKPKAPKGLVENRLKLNDITKAPPQSVSDVWLMIEGNTSTAKKAPMKKTIKFPRKVAKPQQQLNKLRQSTLGIPSTKSTLKGRKGNKKPKKKVQAVISYNGEEEELRAVEQKADEDIKEDDGQEVQVEQSDSFQTSQLDQQPYEFSTIISSPTVSCQKRAIERAATRIESQFNPEEKIDSGKENGEDLIKSDHSLQNSPKEPSSLLNQDESYTEVKTKKRKAPKRAAVNKKTAAKKNESNKVNPVSKPPQKEIKTNIQVSEVPKRSTRASKEKAEPPMIEASTHSQELRPKQDKVELQCKENSRQLTVAQIAEEKGEDGFHSQVHNGLNLITGSLINRMKLVELEIARKEQKLKDDLDSKFKELEEFQKNQKISFGDYLNQLVSQLTSSEKELENWIQTNK